MRGQSALLPRIGYSPWPEEGAEEPVTVLEKVGFQGFDKAAFIVQLPTRLVRCGKYDFFFLECIPMHTLGRCGNMIGNVRVGEAS